MSKNILILIALVVLVIAAGLLYQQPCGGWLNIFRASTTDHDPSAILIEKADRFIRQARLDSAGHYLDLVITRRNDSTISSPLLDTAEALRRQIKQISLLDTGNLYIGVLLNMADREYDDFLKGKYQKKYLGHPELNKLFLNKLYSKNQNWDQATSGSAAAAAGSTPDEATQAINRRKEFAETIKNSFLNLGFDLTVEITGINSTKLILSAPEFDDGWFEKFESDSAMADWHNLGFQQIEIRGDSGYFKVKTW
jgi:phage FluMu protein gp41